MSASSLGVPSEIWETFARKRHDLGAFEALIGRSAPLDLLYFGNPEPPSFSKARFPRIEVWRDAKSSFEAVLGKRSSQPLHALFSNAFFLDEVEESGGRVFAGLRPDEAAPASVLGWNSEHRVLVPIAHDIATYVWVRDSIRAWDRGQMKDDTLVERLAPAQGGWTPHWEGWPMEGERRHAYDQLVNRVAKARKEPLAGCYPERQEPLMTFQQRSSWLVALLVDGQLGSASFDYRQLGWSPDKALAGPHLSKLIPTALYWMWRSWFLKEETRLQQVLEVVGESPSKIIRDAALLLKALETGRRKVGAIEDLPVVRDRVHPKLTDPKAARAFEQQIEAMVRDQQERGPEAENERLEHAARARAEERALVTGQPSAPPIGYGREREGPEAVKKALNKNYDWWITPPGSKYTFVLKYDGKSSYDLKVGDERGVHEIRPPLKGHGFSYAFACGGECLVLLLGKSLVEIDLKLRKTRTLFEQEQPAHSIAATPAGFAVADEARLTFYRFERKAEPEPLQSFEVRSRTYATSVLGDRVLVVPTPERGVFFLALDGERVHALGKTRDGIVVRDIHESEPGVFLDNLSGRPLYFRVHNLDVAHARALRDTSPLATLDLDQLELLELL